MKCSSIRVYRSMEPLTSQTTTSLRGFSLRRRVSRRTSSPPYRALCRSVLRTSSPGPLPRLLAPRAPETGVPPERGHELPRLQHLLRRELGEVPRAQNLARAERAGEVDAVEAFIGVCWLG